MLSVRGLTIDVGGTLVVEGASFSVRAIAMMAAAMAVSSASSGMSRMNERSIFSVSTSNRFR